MFLLARERVRGGTSFELGSTSRRCVWGARSADNVDELPDDGSFSRPNSSSDIISRSERIWNSSLPLSTLCLENKVHTSEVGLTPA